MWITVTSTNLAAIAYTNGDLLCKFHNGSIYQYHEVPEKVFERMKVAESVGKFFHAEILPYYEKVKLELDPLQGETSVA